MISRRAALQGLTAATAVLAASRIPAQDNTIKLLLGATAGTDYTARLVARPRARAENDYEIDRQAQRDNEIYTGIRMVFMQDQAVTESMGPIMWTGRWPMRRSWVGGARAGCLRRGFVGYGFDSDKVNCA